MIELKNISKIYQGSTIETVALNNVSLKIQKSDFLAVLGRSGSGKSTLLNIIGCMDTSDSGDYLFEDINIKNLNHKQTAHFRNKKIGFVFQSFHLIPNLKVIENVEMPLGYAGVDSKERKLLAFSLLEKLGIQNKYNKYPSQLSGGQQQRVAIARALVNNPLLILADEPTGNLDSKTSNEIVDLLQTINEQGTTIILVTHDQSIAKRAKKQIIFDNGGII